MNGKIDLGEDMKLPHVAILEHIEYIWTGKSWYEKSNYMKPAIDITSKLNVLIDEELKVEDEKLFERYDSKAVMDAVLIARSCNQKSRVLRLLERAYKQTDYSDTGIASMLSSFYRETGAPAKAIDVYGAFKGRPSAPLQTTYAAALCDVGKYEEGLNHVRRALGIANSQGYTATEALSVYARIKKEAPILFEGPKKDAEPVVQVELPGAGEKCPLCPGQLAKRRNQATGEYFLGCDRYPDCNYSRSGNTSQPIPVSSEPPAIATELSELINHIKEAVTLFLAESPSLLDFDIHEQAISHRIAVYLEQRLPDSNVDCEYNKNLHEFKQLMGGGGKYSGCTCCACSRRSSLGTTTEKRHFRPDILVHRRGNNTKNLIAIEIKKKETCLFDQEKLKVLTSSAGVYGYKVGAFICFPNKTPEYSFYANGACIE